MPAVLRRFPETVLDIVGQGPERHRLERLTWSLGLASCVRFHGYVPNGMRDELIARAWVAVCPSAFEGWGIACVEASAHGIPVVASRVPGLEDSVRDGVTGVLFPSGDSEALAVELVALLGDPARRHAMGQAGRAWAAEHTWERSAAAFEAVVGGLLPQWHPGAPSAVVSHVELVGLALEAATVPALYLPAHGGTDRVIGAAATVEAR
jgi:glycosyltransferase involved in cell wall biosynthesis